MAKRARGNVSRPSPTAMITGAELAVLAPIVKPALELGTKGVEALSAYIKAEGPITHCVLAAWFERGQYRAALEFINLTTNGGYLEQLTVKKPGADFDFHLAHGERKAEDPREFGLQREGDFSWRKSHEYLPLYIPPSDKCAMVIKFDDDSAKTLTRTNVLELSYVFSVAGGKGVGNKTKSVDILLRRAGPFFGGIER